MAGKPQFANGTPPITTMSRPIPEKTGFNRWIIAIIILVITVMGILFGLIYQSSAIVTTKNFSYSTAANQPSNYYTLQITNVNGAVMLASWPQDSFLINGTVTAKGLGSSPTQVNLVNSSVNGNIIFQAMFPNNAGFLISQTYSVKINVFIPLSVRVSKLVVDNVNGLVQANSLNVTAANFFSENGDIDFSCSICGTGGFSAQTTNGNIAVTFSVVAD